MHKQPTKRTRVVLADPEHGRTAITSSRIKGSAACTPSGIYPVCFVELSFLVGGDLATFSRITRWDASSSRMPTDTPIKKEVEIFP